MQQENWTRRPRRRQHPQDGVVQSKAHSLDDVALTAVLEEIRDNWKLEAKSESIERYFFHVSEVKAIETGKKTYVIGRKGTGKTAIAEFFFARNEYNQFCEKLSFKNFPFND